MNELLNAGQILGRSEMKKIMAGNDEILPPGSGCFVECCNCNNSSCKTFITEGSPEVACIQLCGPGYAGQGGPCCDWDCLA